MPARTKNPTWRTDAVVDRSLARIRLTLFITLIALITGVVFFETLHALFAPLLFALRGIPGGAP